MKKIIIRVISMTILIMTFFIIFGFSSQNGEESKGTSWKIAEKIIDIQPRYKNITQEEKAILIEKYQTPIRKGAHFSIYAVVGLSLASFLCTYEIKNKKRFLVAIIIGFIYATSDEIHQLFVDGRSGQITDVMIDTIGVVCGAIVVLKVNKFIEKNIKEKNDKSSKS